MENRHIQQSAEKSCDIRTGCSGYSYEDWKNVLYPPQSRKQDFLEHYLKEFDLLELNYTYYRQPVMRSSVSIAEKILRLRPETLLAVKLFGGITHERDRALVKEHIAAFREGIEPYKASGLLACLLAQMPQSFHDTPENRDYLARMLHAFRNYPMAVEFRAADWNKPEIIDFLRERNTAFCNVDQPELPGLARPDSIVSADTAYVRFHGRNAANWYKGDSASRYEYSYSQNELESWLKPLQDMKSKSRRVMMFFNNHRNGYAVENARTLKEILRGRGLI